MSAMVSPFFRKKHSLLMIASLILIALNSTLFTSPILGAILMLSFFLSTSALIGPAVLPGRSRSAQTGTGFIVILSLLSIVGSLIYYVGPAFQLFYILLIIVAGLSSTLFGANSETIELESVEGKTSLIFAGATIIILSMAAWWSVLLGTSTADALRSPWDAIEPITLIAIALSTLTAILLLNTRRSGSISLSLIAGIFFSAISIALAIYPLGFGFDPFIHRTTVAHIAEHGTITPKPLYYIGQYALELISAHVFSIPLHFTDRILLPLLSTIIITISAAVGFASILKQKYLPAIAAILLLPLGSFTVTTPQSLAYVFTIAMLFLSLSRLAKTENQTPLWTLFILALAAIFTHPLAGIPAGIYFALVAISSIKKIPSAIKIPGIILTSLAGAVSLPVVFALQAKQSGLNINIALDQLFNLEKLGLTGFLANRFSTPLDALYLAFDNLLWILIILGVVGSIFIAQHKGAKYLHLPLIAAGMWLINYWILSTTLEFSFLIEYERQNYSARLLTLTMIFLIPHVGIAFAGIADKLKGKTPALTISWALILTLLITANVYGAYPRDDNYTRSAGFNVSQTDFDAVYAIEQDAEGDFIVLANQAVSAAALEAFGFKKYYNNDVFYYPIPTGGELYQFYLDMADIEPTKERAIAAMDLAGVDVAYLVINDYWWRSEVIVEHAKTEADEWFSVGNGSVTIFEYQR